MKLPPSTNDDNTSGDTTPPMPSTLTSASTSSSWPQCSRQQTTRQAANSDGQRDFYALSSRRSWQPPFRHHSRDTQLQQTMQQPRPCVQGQQGSQQQLFESSQGNDVCDSCCNNYHEDDFRDEGGVELTDSGITATRSDESKNNRNHRCGWKGNKNLASKFALPFLKKHKQQQQMSPANPSKNVSTDHHNDALLIDSTMDETIDDSYHLQRDQEMNELSNSIGGSRRSSFFPAFFFKLGKHNNNRNRQAFNEGQLGQQTIQDVEKSNRKTNNNDNNNSSSNHEQKHILQELFHWYINRSRTKKLITAMVGITSILVIADAFVLKTGYVQGFLDGFLEWMREHGGLGVWAYIVMLVVTSLIFIPPSILIFASGFIFRSIYGPFHGPVIALLSSYIGAILGGTIGFLRANYMTRDLVHILMRRYPILRAVDRAMIRNSLRVMILMRLNCLIPFGVLNYVFGITGINVAAFVLAMVGVVPWHLWLIYLGASANSVYDESTETSLMAVVLMGMGAAFGVIGMVITWRFARKELQKEVDSLRSAPTIDDYRIKDENLRPQQSFRGSHAIEDSDLCFTDYVLMQFMGQDREVEMEDAHGLEQDYRSKFDWTEIILDDFS
ncbi:hypothetical protein ACHAXS_004308 [Conticribra weissflogii]